MKNIFNRYLVEKNKDINDVLFLSNGNKIKEELKVDEFSNNENEISILVYDISEENNENKEILKQYKEIICPECGDICLIEIEDYKIKLNKCRNNHSMGNILLDEYDDLQESNKLNIICNICNKNKNEIYKNQLYICCNCKINICPLCKLKHDEDHILIDYKLKNYLCNDHGEGYTSYCEECNMNLCNFCKKEHDKNHNYYILNKLTAIEENNINELRIKIDNLKNEINDIVNKLNKIIDNLEIYYNINNNIINNYNLKNKNYEVLMNKNNIYNYNEIVIQDINEILNEKKIENKMKFIYNIYDKMITKDENEIIIKYKIGKENNIRIFGNKFMENNKDHSIINYDNNNYICKIHNMNYNKYCKNCKTNICMACSKEHKNHSIIYYDDMILSEEDNKKEISKLKDYINRTIKKNKRKYEYIL